MAKMIMDARILGAQLITVEAKIYAKVFIAEDADGQTEQIASIQTMNIKEGVEREVFAAAGGFKLGQAVRISIETDRGGKQTVKNEVTHIEALPDRHAAPVAATADKPKV